MDGDSDNWGDRKFHLFHVVSSFESGDATSFDEVLINTDETAQVSAWDIINGFDVSTHHKNGTLDLLTVKIGFGSWLEVWTHNSDLLSSGNGTGENSTESVESTLKNRIKN